VVLLNVSRNCCPEWPQNVFAQDCDQKVLFLLTRRPKRLASGMDSQDLITTKLEAWRLAILAAQPRFATYHASRAIEEARDLWKRARGSNSPQESSPNWERESESDLDKSINELFKTQNPEAEKKYGPIPLPKQFPATGKDFIKLVVPGKASDKSKRMKDYLAFHFGPEKPDKLKPEELLAAFKSKKLGEIEWKGRSQEVLAWWETERPKRQSDNNSQAGKRSARVRAQKRKSGSG